MVEGQENYAEEEGHDLSDQVGLFTEVPDLEIENIGYGWDDNERSRRDALANENLGTAELQAEL